MVKFYFMCISPQFKKKETYKHILACNHRFFKIKSCTHFLIFSFIQSPLWLWRDYILISFLFLMIANYYRFKNNKERKKHSTLYGSKNTSKSLTTAAKAGFFLHCSSSKAIFLSNSLMYVEYIFRYGPFFTKISAILCCSVLRQRRDTQKQRES